MTAGSIAKNGKEIEQFIIFLAWMKRYKFKLEIIERRNGRTG